jgi:hypothetical protein
MLPQCWHNGLASTLKFSYYLTVCSNENWYKAYNGAGITARTKMT